MITGHIGNQIPISANFLRSRAGLSSVGFTILNRDLSVYQARSTAVQEIVLGGIHTGTYTTTISFPDAFEGYLVWDSGQDPIGVEPNRLRIAEEEIVILLVAGSDAIVTAVTGVTDAIGALYEENVMKIPNGPVPSSLRIIRKRPQDPDWTKPISDKTLYIDQRPGRLRYGGPPLT